MGSLWDRWKRQESWEEVDVFLSMRNIVCVYDFCLEVVVGGYMIWIAIWLLGYANVFYGVKEKV